VSPGELDDWRRMDEIAADGEDRLGWRDVRLSQQRRVPLRLLPSNVTGREDRAASLPSGLCTARRAVPHVWS